METSDTDTDSSLKAPAFFPVSEGKLITLYLLSFGLYGIYWFYKNWQLQQAMMDKKIYPLIRAIFSIFFVHALFRRIDSQASHLHRDHRFNAGLYAIFFIVTVVLSNLFDYALGSDQPADIVNNTLIIVSLLLFALSTIPVVKAQATANRVNGDLLGYLNYRYSLWNYLLIATGSVMWIMILAGLVFNLTGLSQSVQSEVPGAPLYGTT